MHFLQLWKGGKLLFFILFMAQWPCENIRLFVKKNKDKSCPQERKSGFHNIIIFVRVLVKLGFKQNKWWLLNMKVIQSDRLWPLRSNISFTIFKQNSDLIFTINKCAIRYSWFTWYCTHAEFFKIGFVIAGGGFYSYYIH